MEYIINYISNLLATNQFFQGGVVLALLGGLLYQLKTVPLLIYRKLLYLVTYEAYFDEKSDFYDCFAEWMNAKYPQKFRRTEVKIVTAQESYTEKPKFKLRFYQYDDSNLIWYRGRPLLVRKRRDKLEGAREFWVMHLNSYSVSGIFARKAIESLCSEILELRQLREDFEGIEVRYNDSYNFKRRLLEITKTFDDLFFTHKNKLLEDLDTFNESRGKYLKKGINYKRGYLFYGKPGTGKTSIATAVARYLKRPLFVISLSSVKDDQQLQQLALDVSNGAVVLFEDIDCVIENREVKGNERLNFSTILNVLDGLYSPSDCIFILTTNKPDVIDDAILRKGRIDLALEICYPTIQDTEDYLSYYYDDKIELLPDKSKQLPVSMSLVQELCLTKQAKTVKEEILHLLEEKNGHHEYTI